MRVKIGKKLKNSQPQLKITGSYNTSALKNDFEVNI